VADYVYGLGGRDIGLGEIEGVYDELLGIAETGRVAQPVTFLGVRD
jgi:pyruvate ferredoxin oxidoreductase alpha subunit